MAPQVEEKTEELKSEEEKHDDDDDGEGEEAAAGGEEDGKGAPVTPRASLRPTREKKPVDRFYATPTPPRASASKSLSFLKGRGMQLKDIPNVAYKLSKRKPDENLQILHSILYGKKTKAHNVKKNIGQFSGYVWLESELEKQRGRIRDRFDKCVKDKLLDFCDVLNLPVKSSVKKEELSERLLEFLESPYATTDLLLADREKKSKKKRGKSTKAKHSMDKTTEKPAKKKKAQAGKKRKLSSEWDEEADNSSGESLENDENDEDALEESDQEGTDSEDREQEETNESAEEHAEKISSDKAAAGKDTPLKSSKSSNESTKKCSPSVDLKEGIANAEAYSSPEPKVERAKRKKLEKDSRKDKSTSAEEEASGRKLNSKPSTETPEKEENTKNVKADSEPTKEEIHAAATDILKGVDFDTVTLSDIVRKLESHFGVDLMHRKTEVKDIITEVINSMSDDEGEAGEENSED